MKKELKSTLGIFPHHVGTGCFVEVDFHVYGPNVQVNFENNSEAEDWIAKESVSWIARYHQGHSPAA